MNYHHRITKHTLYFNQQTKILSKNVLKNKISEQIINYILVRNH
jgi:hypothetical protein